MKRSFIVRREDRVHGHRWVTVVRVDELPSDSIFFCCMEIKLIS